eukprot:1506112-Pyramimonas_sp.AAC.1
MSSKFERTWGSHRVPDSPQGSCEVSRGGSRSNPAQSRRELSRMTQRILAPIPEPRCECPGPPGHAPGGLAEDRRARPLAKLGGRGSRGAQAGRPPSSSSSSSSAASSSSSS